MPTERLLRSSLALLGLALACAGESRPAAPRASAPEPPARAAWPRFAEVESWQPVYPTAFPTRGHLVAPSHALVRTSPEARDSYLSLVTDSVLPDGAVVAMFHQSRDGQSRGLVYVMEKKASAWTFSVLDANGSETPENINVCALCHRGGVADQLFGLPRSLTDRGLGMDASASAVEWDSGVPR